MSFSKALSDGLQFFGTTCFPKDVRNAGHEGLSKEKFRMEGGRSSFRHEKPPLKLTKD